ncbi:MAG TPA: DMT family transporter [Solirubrobacteraceae bacterium]|jgi:drug/metabolite transporter (DMT)-like permease|nr:DMT family transporter [Solirubrobacteraceae bacterium]
MSNKAAAPMLALVAVLSWGGMFPIAAHAIPHVEPLHLTALRYGLASLAFVALLWHVEGFASLRPQRVVRLWILGTLGFAGFNLLSYIGLEHTGPRNAALIVPTMPLVTALVRWLRDGVKPAGATIGATFLALAGVMLVISHGDLGSLADGGVGFGSLLVLAGVTGFVLYTLGAADFPEWSPLRYTTLSAVLGTVSIVAITEIATAAGWVSAPSAADVGAIWPDVAFIVVMGAVVAVLAWNAAIRSMGPQNTSLFINLVPVTAFVISIAGGYRPGVVELAGATLTIVALAGGNLLVRGWRPPWLVAVRRPAARTPQPECA